MEIFSQMLWPLLACFTLVAIHAYLGIHVLARKVIFVDLALAQIAGLGAVYGVFLGLSFETNAWAIKIISVAFTLLGALLITMTRSEKDSVPHEAIIGIIYASALSVSVLLTSNLPHGAEEVQQMLAGSILWVEPREVMQTAILYSAIGLVHYVFRRQFFKLSNDLASKSVPTRAMRLWDFLFYATFGVVVTSSVGMGGVLLVFGYLVIPSVIGVLVARSLRARLLVAWSAGALMSIFGVVVSYYADIPSGPCIVVLLALLLVLIGFARGLKSLSTRVEALANIIVWSFVALALVLMPQWFKRYMGHDHEEKHALWHQLGHHEEDSAAQQGAIKHMLLSASASENIKGLNSIQHNMSVELGPIVVGLLENNDSNVREHAAQVIGTMSWHEALPGLIKAFQRERDDFIKLELAESVLKLGEAQGFLLFITIWRKSKSELARMDALMHVQKWLPDIKLEDKALIKWLESEQKNLIFDEENGRYIISKS